MACSSVCPRRLPNEPMVLVLPVRTIAAFVLWMKTVAAELRELMWVAREKFGKGQGIADPCSAAVTRLEGYLRFNGEGVCAKTSWWDSFEENDIDCVSARAKQQKMNNNMIHQFTSLLNRPCSYLSQHMSHMFCEILWKLCVEEFFLHSLSVNHTCFAHIEVFIREQGVKRYLPVILGL